MASEAPRSAAGAAIYDFTAEGNRLEAGYTTFETGVTGANPMPTGLTITASDPDGAAYAYMEGDSGGPGGLGVCSDLRANLTCDPNSDDNQIAGETINIVATAGNEITSLTFTGNHDPVVDGTILLLTVDGGIQQEIDLYALSIGDFAFLSLAGPASSISYTLKDAGEIYLTSLTTVPVPAAVWLFGTALIGFIGMGRRTSVV